MHWQCILFYILAATALILDISPIRLKSKMQEIAGQVRNLGILGPFHPKFDVIELFEKELNQIY